MVSERLPGRRVDRAAGALVSLVGLTVLAGWSLDINGLKSILPGWASMKANTALGFALSGAALWLLAPEPDADAQRRWGRAAGMACAASVALLGLLTLAEHLLGWDLHIDQLLFRDAARETPSYAPGRMAPATAISFLLQGSAMLLIDARIGKTLWPAEALTLIAGLLGLLGAVGYVYGVTGFYQFGPYESVAVHTALSFLALSTGILLARPRRGAMAILSSDAAGGTLARRVLPFILVVPLVLGRLRLWGGRAGYFEAEVGISLLVLSTIVLLTIVVILNARSLNRIDAALSIARIVEASEKRYRQLAEAALDAIVVADELGLIRSFNPAAERMFGYTAAEVLDQEIPMLIPSDLRGRHRQGFARYLRTREPHLIGHSVELRGRRKDGTEFTLELSLSAISVNGGTQFMGAIRDLTERNRLRDIAQRSERLASIGMLTAGIAHEINNPLAYVTNNLAVLERDARGLLELIQLQEDAGGVVAESVRAKAETIDLPYIQENFDQLMERTRNGVDRVARIVHSMRSLARMGPPQIEETSLGEVVGSSLEMIRGQLQRRGIKVVVDCGQAPRLRLEVTQIGQVVLNLLVNAEQSITAAGREGEGRIDVVARATASEVQLEIRDNGTGIAPDDLPRIFDPFFTTKPVGEGMGLGLSLANTIITAHGGRIEVESKPAEGSCFRVVLPTHPPGGPP